VYIVAGLIVAALMALAWAWDAAEANRAKRAEEIDAADAEAEATAAVFPVPPMDLPHYHGIDLFTEEPAAVSPGASDAAGNEVTGA
jgi:NADH-quinone oxidoreductase subunit H